MTDIDQMSGNINQPETEGEMSVITGFAPAATIGDYINTVNEYTHEPGHCLLITKDMVRATTVRK